ncbi:hypothetical protein EGW08_006735 [Elysia chlorotica]|uniref:Uncharacterized protein n=1 Tax=Elysia chlorotica TaxID=188477 RepID=A0A3S1C804_ELYCH|nr:hypothetical protein EGW08_006735 [Elysia chlorotica]
MGLAPSINWGSASSTVSLRYDTAQSSLNSSTSSIASAGRGSVDASSFDSLFGGGGLGGGGIGGVGGGGGGNKPSMGMMSASGGPTGVSPMRPSSVMQPQGGGGGANANFMMMGQPRPNMMQNTSAVPMSQWGGGASASASASASSVFPPMAASSASSVPPPGPYFGGGGGGGGGSAVGGSGNLFQSNPSVNWGGSGGPVIGARAMPTGQPGLMMQPQRPQQQQQQQQTPKPLSNQDLDDLLG